MAKAWPGNLASVCRLFALQLLIASHKQFRGGSGRWSPSVLAFSFRVWGLVSREHDVLVSNVYMNHESMN